MVVTGPSVDTGGDPGEDVVIGEEDGLVVGEVGGAVVTGDTGAEVGETGAEVVTGGAVVVVVVGDTGGAVGASVEVTGHRSSEIWFLKRCR